jgi:peptide-methionine (S)-S-oxide reductase
MRWIAFASLAVVGSAALVAWNQPSAPKPGDPNAKGTTTLSFEEAKKKGHEVAVFGGGCFWCTERDFRRVKAGIIATDVGYMGGTVKNPSYEQVCTHTTGHIEVTRVEYDPKVISYRQVVDAFFQMHDPTQVMRQGPDVGEQYQSVIFTYSDDQAKIADAARADVAKKLNRKLATVIRPAETYWRAEDYHQQYYEKMGA